MRLSVVTHAVGLAGRACVVGAALLWPGLGRAQFAPPAGYQGFDRIIPPISTGQPSQAPAPTMPPFYEYYQPARHGHSAQLVPYGSGLTYDPFAPLVPGYAAPYGAFDPYGGYYYGAPHPILSPPPANLSTAPLSLPRYAHVPTEIFAEHPDLAQAAADIERAFRTGEIALFEKHLPSGGTISVRNIDGATRRVPASAYLSAARAALAATPTVAYTLNDVESAGRGAWRVVGIHSARGADGAARAYEVGFVLHKVHGQWLIAEVAGHLASTVPP